MCARGVPQCARVRAVVSIGAAHPPALGRISDMTVQRVSLEQVLSVPFVISVLSVLSGPSASFPRLPTAHRAELRPRGGRPPSVCLFRFELARCSPKTKRRAFVMQRPRPVLQRHCRRAAPVWETTACKPWIKGSRGRAARSGVREITKSQAMSYELSDTAAGRPGAASEHSADAELCRC